MLVDIKVVVSVAVLVTVVRHGPGVEHELLVDVDGLGGTQVAKISTLTQIDGKLHVGIGHW